MNQLIKKNTLFLTLIMGSLIFFSGCDTLNQTRHSNSVNKNNSLMSTMIDNQIIIKYRSESQFIVTTGSCNQFINDPNLEYCEPDHIVQTAQSTNPALNELWGFKNTNIPELWTTIPGSEIIIAVLDEGVDINHPSLRNNIWVNSDEIPGNGIDDDNNGYIDDIHGWNFANNTPTVFLASDGDVHGTHISGTIAGIIGVNPNAKIMVLKFISPQGGRMSDAARAMNYALQNGAALSNHSYGGNYSNQTLYNALKKAAAHNHFIIAAAGNKGENTNYDPFYPASYDLDTIISIAASTSSGALSFFSNYGSTHIDIAAPGMYIYSTLPNNQYGKLSGTSMATPLVTGIIGLCVSRYPSLSTKKLKEMLMSTVQKTPKLAYKVKSGGIINAKAFLELTEMSSGQGVFIEYTK
jgi:subtilisin family serine protease